MVAPGWTDHRLRTELHPDDQDDYPALLKGELRSRAEVVADACRTLEEVIVTRIDTGMVAVLSTPPTRRPEVSWWTATGLV